MIFVGILVRFGVSGHASPHARRPRARIKAELDEAQRLRQEAEAVLAQYQRKQRARPRRRPQAIIVNARSEAERLAAEAKAKVEDFIARRTKMAETKIAQAEAQALADVRAAAADAAVAAAEKILAETTHGAAAEALIAKGIRDLKAKLN